MNTASSDSPMSFRIERASTAHVGTLCSIERAAVQMFREHAAWPFYSAMSIPPEQLEQDILRGLVWVALVDEIAEPVGFVWLDAEPHGQVIGIAELDVLPAFHRRGIGAALLEHACAWARAAGYRRVDLGTLADIAWNAPFYSGHGFSVVDKRDPAYAYARDRDRENGFPESLRVFMSRALAPPVANEWTAWPAPAKLQLFLRLIGEREDGRREQQAVVHFLDWSDEIRLRARDDGAIRVQGIDEQNMESSRLVLDAAALLRERLGASLGADIEVERRIPANLGLGEYSAHAATVLMALNHLWKGGLGTDELRELASLLKADVLAFVHGRSAWITGVGDRLRSIKLPRRWYVVVDPHESAPATHDLDEIELTRFAPPATISSFASGETLDNAFEPIARARCPRIAAALDWLESHGGARLSGDGRCVFLETATPERAEAVARRCPTSFTAWVAEGVGISPLHRALARHATG